VRGERLRQKRKSRRTAGKRGEKTSGAEAMRGGFEVKTHSVEQRERRNKMEEGGGGKDTKGDKRAERGRNYVLKDRTKKAWRESGFSVFGSPETDWLVLRLRHREKHLDLNFSGGPNLRGGGRLSL